MSRLSQCATCDLGRWNCGHCTPEDDTECPNMNILYKSVLFLLFILLVGCSGSNQGTSTEDSSDSVVIKPDSVEENTCLNGIDASMNDTIVRIKDFYLQSVIKE